MLSKKITLSLLMVSFLATSVQAQPQIDALQRFGSAAMGLMFATMAYQTAKNTKEIIQDFTRDPRASNTYWNLRAGVTPLTPMLFNGGLSLAFAAATTAFAIPAITGNDILGFNQR